MTERKERLLTEIRDLLKKNQRKIKTKIMA